ncbi:MAG TPA: ComF family protein [Anseongella sp.]|nr:ComF family protein [Anseongella sp.]
MFHLKEYFSDFLSLAFPAVCQACGKTLYRQENILCTYCRQNLPYTGFHLDRENKTARQFWGKVEIRAAASFLYFRKGERVQHLLHQLKYRQQTEIGRYLGLLYGSALKEAEGFSETEIICPLPLHGKSRRKRGYNQSEFFAAGLGISMEKEVDCGLLCRTGQGASQTRKSRYERFLNVEKAFSVRDPARLSGKHILLADDVITTGATLAACAGEILKIPGTRVSIATIAYAP